MTDPFVSFARAPGAPFTKAVPIIESEDEIAVTAAVQHNGYSTYAKPLMADDDLPVCVTFGEPGIFQLRVKKALSISFGNILPAGEDLPEGDVFYRLIALY